MKGDTQECLQLILISCKFNHNNIRTESKALVLKPLQYQGYKKSFGFIQSCRKSGQRNFVSLYFLDAPIKFLNNG